MKTLLGSQLAPSVQQHALAQYVHRFTRQHKPAWANKINAGKPYTVQFDSDNDWLANTRFHVRDDGQLSGRHKYCESSPTWPDNPELRTK